MEAMKPPFYPLHQQLQEQLRNDPIGTVQFVRAGCSLTNVDPAHPSFKVENGGGALMGIGVYGAWLSTEWLGNATTVQVRISVVPVATALC
jgi:predicted dehydrogenase